MDFNDINAKLNAWLNETIDNIKALPNDEKYAYGSITLGVFFVVAAVILW